MRIQDVIDLAKYSELNSTSLKDNDTAIILFINAGLLELYKRFPLQINEHIVTLLDGVTMYDLPDDFMYVLEAYGEPDPSSSDTVNHLTINDPEDPYSVFFPGFKQVQVPLTATGSFVSLLYVAKPPSYTEDDMSEILELPDTLVECLLHYIGYKAHLGIRGDTQAENNAHFIRFERSCQKALDLGVAYPLDSMRMVDRLADRNFV